MEKQLNKHCSPTSKYKIGDYVWLSATHIYSLGCQKLAPHWIGPFKVLKVKLNTLQIAVQGKTHLVINVSQLKSWVLTIDRKVPYPPPVTYDTEGEPEFEVEKIIDERMINDIMEYGI